MDLNKTVKRIATGAMVHVVSVTGQTVRIAHRRTVPRGAQTPAQGLERFLKGLESAGLQAVWCDDLRDQMVHGTTMAVWEIEVA